MEVVIVVVVVVAAAVVAVSRLVCGVCSRVWVSSVFLCIPIVS